MSRARATHRSVTRVGVLTAAMALAVPFAPAALAADPEPSYRPDRPAWDRVDAITFDATGDAATGSTRLIVRFRAGTTAPARFRATAGPNVRRIADIPTSGIAVVAATDDPIRTMAALEADPNIADVSIDHQRSRDLDPDDEAGWTELWGLHNTGQRLFQGEPGTEGSSNVDIDGLQALGITDGDTDVVVAVIDDGVDFSHPDLAGQAWTNPGEAGGGRETNGVDDDHNGYIDDVHGYDFCHDDASVHDFDDDFHGTHVAGTIAAKLDGGGIVGVAPGIRIMALKFINNSKLCGFDSQAIEAITYAKSFGVRIANASWGGRGRLDSAPQLRSAIAGSEMLFVTSAGNEGIDNDHNAFPAIPASFDLPNILSVAAIDNRGRIPGFSNYGATRVDIAAPGAAILSSLPADANDPVGWGWLDGTSMAAPHVTGVAALVLSQRPELGDDIAALKARLLASGKTASKTAHKTATGKIIDAFRALDFVAPVGAAPTGAGFVKNSILGKTTVHGRFSWPAATDSGAGVASYRVGVKVNTGAWTTHDSSTTERSTDRTVKFGNTYGFRVRPRDLGGNWGEYAEGPAVKPGLHQESTSLATYTGKWATSKNASWSRGKTRYTRSAGASVTFRFTGRAFALVAPKGSTRGAFKLYVDGVMIGTIDLHRSKSLARVLVATKTWSASAAHEVKVVAVGTKGHSRVDIDALVVMR